MSRYIKLKLGYRDYVTPYTPEAMVVALGFIDSFTEVDEKYVDRKDDDNSDTYWHREDSRPPALTIVGIDKIEDCERHKPVELDVA